MRLVFETGETIQQGEEEFQSFNIFDFWLPAEIMTDLTVVLEASEPRDEGGGDNLLSSVTRLNVSVQSANVSEDQCPLGGSDPWTPFLVTLQVIIFFLTIVGNTTILYLLAKHPSLHQESAETQNN